MKVKIIYATLVTAITFVLGLAILELVADAQTPTGPVGATTLQPAVGASTLQPDAGAPALQAAISGRKLQGTR